MYSILAARSDFSVGESILSVERLIDQAVAVGAKAVALTDNMSVTGLIDFTKRAQKADIKPIIGCRLRFVDDPAWRKTKESKKTPPFWYLTYYVLSERGLKALFKLLTLANSEERYYFEAKLGFDDLYTQLLSLTAEDVIITSSDMHSVVGHKDAASILSRIKDALGASNVFLALTPIDTPLFDTVNAKAIALADQLSLPTIVTRPVHYGPGEFDAAELMGAIAANQKTTEIWHKTPVYEDLHPKTAKEIIDVDVRAAITRLAERRKLPGSLVKQKFLSGLQATRTLVDNLKYEWSKEPISLPKMADDEFATLKAECNKGWNLRFAEPVFGHKPDALRPYMDRLKYELQTLKTLGFAGYFLLVQDVVRFAKSRGILVGPGRGSVGGSLVAYLMGITDCDPIRFGLLFERFINPDRLDLPDADLDFMSERRHEVVDYLVEKYGTTHVAGISNFNTLGPASCVRDVGRIVGLDESEYRASKFMPKKFGAHVPMEEAAEQVAEVATYRDKYPDLWKLGVKLEGTMKSLGRHAAGVVVGACDLTERAVVERRKEGSVVCWDKRIVEDQGLVKMDLLGLTNLDHIALILDYIFERHGKKVDLLRIPLDDQKTLEAFAKGLTTGIFQFESGGMRRLLKNLGQDGVITFEDITAATALYRPGPMETGMMDDYWRRKQGLDYVEYDHPLMEKTLKPTFGVMIYQEQVMQIARDIAGYTMAGADKLRKIMGKKLPEEMAKERNVFVDGAVRTVDMDVDEAGRLFDKIEGFAGYGFNRSHSVEYTLISYQSMWLKTYYPVEFFAAALSLMPDDKLPGLMLDMQRYGIEIDTPDINLSTDRFEILTDTKLSIPFNRVKGLSTNTAKAILDAREAGPFTSKEDFVARVERRTCNVKKQSLLDQIGAFARIEPSQPPAKDPSRIKDQRELIPGLILDTVPIDRDIQCDPLSFRKLLRHIADYKERHKLDGVCVKPHIGKHPKIMVVFDAPSTAEEGEGSMARGDGFVWEKTAQAMGEIGFSQKDLYVTALLKRPKAGKQVTPDEIRRYAPELGEEIAILKPPIIVALGSAAVRHFIPDLKGKVSDVAGKIVYLKDVDANLVIGFSPGELWHDPEKGALLEEVFAKAMSLTSI